MLPERSEGSALQAPAASLETEETGPAAGDACRSDEGEGDGEGGTALLGEAQPTTSRCVLHGRCLTIGLAVFGTALGVAILATVVVSGGPEAAAYDAQITPPAAQMASQSQPQPHRMGKKRSMSNCEEALRELSQPVPLPKAAAAVIKSQLASDGIMIRGLNRQTTSTSTTPTLTSTTTLVCPPCAPKERTAPDVVIPFYERDLCKLKYTAKSIAVNDPDHVLGDIYLAWVSLHSAEEYADDLKEIHDSISSSRKVHLIDFSEQVTTSELLTGWFAQQIVKLKIASAVSTSYYLVLDAKNTLIKPITADMLFTPCNLAKIQAEFPYNKIPLPHRTWYEASANALKVSTPDHGFWPASITPVLIHKQTVLDMLTSINEDPSLTSLCNGPLCDMLGCRAKSGHGATEFTLYTLYAYQKAKMECIHYVEKMTAFSLDFEKGWQEGICQLLEDRGYETAELRGNLTVEDKDEFPLAWFPGGHDDLPTESQFPLKFQDLTARWSASLWRGVKGNRELLSKINIATLEDINSGFRLFPLVFGAQPASLSGMAPEVQKHAVDLLVELYMDANLHDPAEKSTEELIDCVVGWKN